MRRKAMEMRMRFGEDHAPLNTTTAVQTADGRLDHKRRSGIDMGGGGEANLTGLHPDILLFID